MKSNGFCLPSRKIHQNGKFAFFSLIVNKVWQESITQSNYHNRTTLLHQNEYTSCWVLRSDSGPTHVHQTSRHDNAEYDSGGRSGSDSVPDWATPSKQTRTTNQHILVLNAWKSWKNWRSHPKTNTKTQKFTWTERQREVKHVDDSDSRENSFNDWTGRKTTYGGWNKRNLKEMVQCDEIFAIEWIRSSSWNP